jgi:fatty-acyl-CoA synthase
MYDIELRLNQTSAKPGNECESSQAPNERCGMGSYARGPKGEVVRKSVGATFLETAERFGDRIAVVSRHQNIRLTWAQYSLAVQRTAVGLRAMGLVPGDRVGIWATNCAEWVMLQFGCALADIVLVNVNPAYRSHELSFVLKKSRSRRASTRTIASTFGS